MTPCSLVYRYQLFSEMSTYYQNTRCHMRPYAVKSETMRCLLQNFRSGYGVVFFRADARDNQNGRCFSSQHETSQLLGSCLFRSVCPFALMLLWGPSGGHSVPSWCCVRWTYRRWRQPVWRHKALSWLATAQLAFLKSRLKGLPSVCVPSVCVPSVCVPSVCASLSDVRQFDTLRTNWFLDFVHRP